MQTMTRDFKKEMDATEKRMIAHTLLVCQGNITRTAAALDLARNTLKSRMGKYWPDKYGPGRNGKFFGKK